MDYAEIQVALKNAGYYHGEIDGRFGPLSKAALLASIADRDGEGDAGLDPNDVILAQELERDEGCPMKDGRAYAYQDSRGFWTIGIGRLIDKRLSGGLTREECLYLKRNDIRRFKNELDVSLPWWRDLDPVRQRVLQNMAFNMGLDNLLDFKATLANIREGRYDLAAHGMRASQWAKQVGARAERLAGAMETGVAQ